jgi:hypothetical protein
MTTLSRTQPATATTFNIDMKKINQKFASLIEHTKFNTAMKKKSVEKLNDDFTISQIKYMLMIIFFGVKSELEKSYKYEIPKKYINKLGLTLCVQILKNHAVEFGKKYNFYKTCFSSDEYCSETDSYIVGIYIEVFEIKENLRKNYIKLIKTRFNTFSDEQIIQYFKDGFVMSVSFYQSIINHYGYKIYTEECSDLINHMINDMMIKFLIKDILLDSFETSLKSFFLKEFEYDIPEDFKTKYTEETCIKIICSFLTNFTNVRDKYKIIKKYDVHTCKYDGPVVYISL